MGNGSRHEVDGEVGDGERRRGWPFEGGARGSTGFMFSLTIVYEVMSCSAGLGELLVNVALVGKE